MRFRIPQSPRRGVGSAAKRSRQQSRRPILEGLEDRKLLATPAVQITNPAGPITDIVAGVDGSFQVFYTGFTNGQFYPPNDFVGGGGGGVGGVGGGSNTTADAGFYVRHADRVVDGIDTPYASSSTMAKPWTAVSQAQSGNSVTSTFNNSADGETADKVLVTQTVTYTPGQQYFTRTHLVKNTGTAAETLDLFDAGDIYLANSDAGVGLVTGGSDPSHVAIGGTDRTGSYNIFFQARSAPGLTNATNYEASRFNTIWSTIGGSLDFNNTANTPTSPNPPYTGDPNYYDNGAGLEWRAVTIPAGGSVTVSDFVGFGNITTVTTSQTIQIVGQPIQASAGQAYTGEVATFTNTGSTDPAASYTAVIDWGDGTSTTGTVVADPNSAGQFIITGVTPRSAIPNVNTTVQGTGSPPAGVVINGVHYYTRASATPFPVGITVVDTTAGVQNTGTTSAIVSEAPVTVNLVPLNGITEGRNFNAPFAHFTSGNRFAGRGDFTATIDYGDGSGGTGLIQSDGNGGFFVYGNHTYINHGTYNLTVTVTDSSYQNFIAAGGTPGGGGGTIGGGGGGGGIGGGGGGSTGGGTTPVTVTPGTGTGSITAVNGTSFTNRVSTPFNGQVATFKDADATATAATFAAVIDWGDGTTSDGTITADPTVTGQFDVAGMHTYATTGTGTGTPGGNGITQGTFPVSISITATDAMTSTGSATTTATVVSDFPITATGVRVVGVQGGPINAKVATFTDPDTSVQTADFAAVIDWGDGTTSAGTVQGQAGSAGQFDVIGAHTYAQAGTDTILVTITHTNGGATATANSSAVIVAGPVLTQSGTATGPVLVPVSPVLFVTTGAGLTTVEGSPFSGTVATFLPISQFTTAGQFTATLTYPDGSTGAATVRVDPTSANRYVVVPASPHVFLGVGSEPIGVQVNDTNAAGTSYAQTVPILVTPAPLIAQIAPVGGLHRGQTFSGVVANFNDGNPLAKAGDFRAIISWGDGHQSPGTVLPEAGAFRFAVTGTNTYAAQGNLPLRVVITDTASGATTTVTGQAVIIPYMPTAAPVSFTTGQRVPFRTIVATFTDPDPLAVPGNFRALVNWGDGRSEFAGTIQHDRAGGNKYDVVAAHTYTTTGNHVVTVQITAAGAPPVIVHGNGRVTPPRQFSLTGRLAPDSNTGTNPALNVTTDRTPRFFGFAGPNATVHLDIIRLGSNAVIRAGQVRANARGLWSITAATALADGSYTVVANATDAQGNANSRSTVLVNSPLVIETSAPRVTNAQYNPGANAILVTFSDAVGLTPAALTNLAAYRVARITANGFAGASVQSVTLSGPPTAPVATLHLSGTGGRSFFGVQLEINGARVTNLAGIALEGDFTNGFPTRSAPGSLFNGQFLGSGPGLVTAIPAIYQINTAGAAAFLTFLGRHTR